MTDFQIAGDNAPHIRITRIEDSFGPASPGQSTRVKVVYFKVDNLNESHVEIPLTENWVEEARSAVVQHAADLLELYHTQFGGM